MTVALAPGCDVPAPSEAGPVVGQTSLAPDWARRFPPRAVPACWPTTELGRPQLVELVAPACSAGLERRRGLSLLLGWLEDQPGASWQHRWLASGADATGEAWAQGPVRWLEQAGKYSSSRLELMTSSLLAVVGADGVRPSLAWLLTGGKSRKVARNMIRSRDAEGFDQLRRHCEDDPAITPQAQAHILFRTAVVIAAKGGVLADITVGDVLEVLEAELGLRGQMRSGSAMFRVLRRMGIFGADVPTLREIPSLGQRSVEELVDRYPIACRPVRDLLVDYLKERQPVLDYGSLRNQSYVLASCFWLDVEAHAPGIDTLRLPAEVATGWKRRLQRRNATTRGTAGEAVTVERLSCLDVLASVRAFYLDLGQWALEDPARWSRWVALCPIGQDELTRRKAVRRRKARMDARTRERLPVLPVLVGAVDQWRKDTQALLAAGRAASRGSSSAPLARPWCGPCDPRPMSATPTSPRFWPRASP